MPSEAAPGFIGKPSLTIAAAYPGAKRRVHLVLLYRTASLGKDRRPDAHPQDRHMPRCSKARI